MTFSLTSRVRETGAAVYAFRSRQVVQVEERPVVSARFVVDLA